jgi:hypothetical protein
LHAGRGARPRVGRSVEEHGYDVLAEPWVVDAEDHHLAAGRLPQRGLHIRDQHRRPRGYHRARAPAGHGQYAVDQSATVTHRRETVRVDPQGPGLSDIALAQIPRPCPDLALPDSHLHTGEGA